MRYNAMEETYEEVTVLGHPMLFTAVRIDRSTVPKGMYLYEVRHDDDQQGIPCQIANWILVNFWGTLISNKPIRLEKNAARNNAFRDIEIDDWNYEGANSTLQKYMETHPPQMEKNKNHER